MENNTQYVEPEITRIKYNEQINQFRNIKNIWREKGIFLINAEFPTIEVLYTVPKLKPSAVAFAVRVNFSNYDVEPPSLKFISPFTGEVLNRNEILMQFLQVNIPQMLNSELPVQNQLQTQDLLQGALDQTPFFCIPGIKEYHDHPAHSGDPWLLYRGRGEGTLGFILDQLYNHSIPRISGHQIVQKIVGFEQKFEISLI